MRTKHTRPRKLAVLPSLACRVHTHLLVVSHTAELCNAVREELVSLLLHLDLLAPLEAARLQDNHLSTFMT